MDLQAIANGIATVVGTVTAGGESATATADLPNQVAKLALLVYPPVGALEIGVSRMRNDHYDFALRLLRDPIDVPARSRALYAWATALRDRVETNMDLDLPYVAKANPILMRMEIDGQTYADALGAQSLFDVVEIIVRVLVREVVATVSM